MAEATAQPQLQGKKALVTGAAQGIGRATAELLAANGAAVLAGDLNPDQPPARGGDVTLAELDVTSPAQVAKVVGGFGADILVNVAGIVHDGTVLDCAADDFDQALDVNVRSMFLTCKAALPAMIARGDGCIVNISSVASSIKGVPMRFAYSTSKAAVLGLTMSIAADYVTAGVRANAICPGTVRSPSWEQRARALAAKEGISEQEAVARFVARQPMGRIGTVDEIAAMVLHLASAAGSFTSGQQICIDGGWSVL